MRIAYLAAGAGTMYCGACHRDMVLVRGLQRRGHEIDILPLYTPLKADGEVPKTTRVFYGGLVCYLRQLGGPFNYMPTFMVRALSWVPLLRWVSRWAVSTQPGALGPMTVSVLAGRDGRQRRELNHVIEYLEQTKPELVSITNSMLSGLAPVLKERLKVPVVCSLQGEDRFLSELPPSYFKEARRLTRENARSIDLFLAPGEAHAKRMVEFLAVPPDRTRVVRTGLDGQDFPIVEKRRRDPFTIGYLSAITPHKGLDLLVEAFGILCRDLKRDAKLRIAGRVLDAAYWRKVEQAIEQADLKDHVEYLGEVDRGGKLDFLHSCSVYVLPSRAEECRGLAAMEALACGVPAILPDSGVFPELAGHTNGGVLVSPSDPQALARAIRELMDDPERADTLGALGAEGIRRKYSAEDMTESIEGLYRDILSGWKA